MTQDAAREYIAFISYRHLPLQMEVAKAIHRRIERYVIPRSLRKDGKRKLGYVFRDQDELPISGALSDNIQYALDHSEYLIVICTPETAESIWCVREITSFLEHHDRDHVLAVLADGLPADSFPPQITEIRDEDGTLLSHFEPLAANIVSPTAAGRRRKLRGESLRILAALIGCPYDALYRREQRYRFRRLAAASAAALCVAAMFVGMLLERNARIRDQLRISQINESTALAALSRSAYREGDYNGSIEMALRALPSEAEERPYMAEAEYALSDTLPLYNNGILAFDQSFEQSADIWKMEMSRDGRHIVTIDVNNRIRMFDGWSGRRLWEKQADDNLYFRFLDRLGGVFAYGTMYSAADGEELWSTEEGVCYQFSPDQTLIVYVKTDMGESVLSVADTSGGTLLCAVPLEGLSGFFRAAAVTDDGRFAAVLDDEGTLAVSDLKAGTLTVVDRGLNRDLFTDRRMMFLDDGDLLTAFAGDERSGAGVAVYDMERDWERRFDARLEIDLSAIYRSGGFNMASTVDVLDVSRDRIAFGSEKNLYLLDRETGEIAADVFLPDYICSGAMYDNDSLGLVLENGLITMCTSSGILSYTAEMYYFDSRCALYRAAQAGDRYGTSVFAIVTLDNSSRIAVIRWVENEDLTPATSDEPGIKEARLCVSPSGSRAAAYRFDTDKNVLYGELLDISGEGPSVPFEVAMDEFFCPDSGDVFFTEDGKILARGRVFDLMKGRQYGLTETGEMPDKYLTSCKNMVRPEEGAVYTAVLTVSGVLSLWRDAEPIRTVSLPGEDVPLACRAFGANGYLIVSGKTGAGLPEDSGMNCMAYDIADDRWISLPEMDASVETVCAVGDTEPLMAAPAREGGVQLIDLKTGEVRLNIPVELLSLRKLLFAMEDRVLLAFSYTGALQIYDTQTGERLADEYFGSKNLHFHDTARYSAQQISAGDRLLIICEDERYTEASDVCMDIQSWECAGFYSGIIHYCQETERAVVKPSLEGFYFSPFFSLNEIMARGRDVLDRGEE